MNKRLITLSILLSSALAFAGSLQNEDFKTPAKIKSAVLSTTGDLSSSSAPTCLRNLASTSNLASGLFIYDTTNPTFTSSGTTISAIGSNGSGACSGVCGTGCVVMSTSSSGTATGDSVTFGGQLSQLLNDTNIWVSSVTPAQQLSTAITTGAIGSPGGSKNYLTTYKSNTGNGNFEFGSTTGWSLGTVGTLTNGLPTGSPTFGSGASGNLSISAITSGAIGGTYSLSYASSTATTSGNMLASSAFSIDTEDQAKVMTVKYYYTANSGAANDNFSGTSSNSFAWAAYDVTNSAWLSSAGNFCMTQSSGIGYCTGTFQTASTTASIRFVFYSANASSGATTMYLDDFSAGPQTAPMGPTMTDWISFTPTGAWSTNTTYTGQYRRVGDSAEIRYNLALSGAPTSATLTVNMPSGLVIDTSNKIPNFSQDGTAVGYASGIHSNVYGTFLPTIDSTTKILLTYQSTTTASQASVTQAAPITWGNGDSLSISIRVPIVGWSSNSSQSADTDTRVISFSAAEQVPTGTVSGSHNIAKFQTVTKDTAGAYSISTGQYTVPVSGQYATACTLEIDATYAANNVAQVCLYGGSAGTTQYACGAVNAISSGTTFLSPSISFNIPANAGDLISCQSSSNGTSPSYGANETDSVLSINRLSGPAVVTATESVNARYHGATGTITGAASAITYTTKDFDSHNAYSGTTYTVPVSGKYQVNAEVRIAATYAAGDTTHIYLYKNGSEVTDWIFVAASTAVSILQPIGSDIVSCVAGDTLVIEASTGATSPTVNASNFDNYVSISRIGN